MNLLAALLAIVIGYLIGSISFARLVAGRFAPQQDITKIVVEGTDGEGRFESDAVSSTSVRLHLGPRYGCLVGILDILKAAVPALVFKWWHAGSALLPPGRRHGCRRPQLAHLLSIPGR